MKKFFLILLFCPSTYLVMGQSVRIGWYDNVSESQSTGYVSLSVYNSTLFPDSLVKTTYNNGQGGTILLPADLEGVGEVFDPQSYIYETPITTSNPPFTIDSIGLVYKYNYVFEPNAAPDTLIFQFYDKSAIDTGAFNASGTNEVYATVGYDYTKNLGTGEIGMYKYILGAGDATIGTNARVIRVPTFGKEGRLKAKDLFAFTVSYRPGYKYQPGDTIDETWVPAPKNLHSHFSVLEGFTNGKYSNYDDFEGNLSINPAIRYNNGLTGWSGMYIPGSAWTNENQFLWSMFHTQRFVAVDAGLGGFVSPMAATGKGYCGDTTLPVTVLLSNYLGTSDLTSATISWWVNGQAQKDYKWTGKLIQSNSTSVTLGTIPFTVGTNNIQVVVNNPDGAGDSLTFNDTAHISIVINPMPSARFSGSQIASELVHFIPKDLILASYSWNLGDGSPVSTAISPTHQYASAGIYSVTLSVTGGGGCSAAFDTTVNATFSGIALPSTSQFSLTAYPNPFSNDFTISYRIPKSSAVKIELYNATGQLIEMIVDKTQEAGKYQYDISTDKYHLDAGVYLLKFYTADGFISKQIVKF